MSEQNILIDGTALFQDNTENAGVVETGLFDGSAVNTGITTTAAFSGTAANHGTVVEEATFSDSAVNTGTVAVAAFVGSASNAGTITQEASFADTTTNSGVVSGTATFSGSAENDGGTVAGEAVFADTAVNTGSVAGPVVFTGSAVNNGTVAEAIFLGSSQNGGTVTLSAVFAENAGNLGTGLIQGDAVFADNTVNAGTIQGNAEIAATANGEQGTVQGSVTEYVQPDGAFAHGYFSGGSKTAPGNYATVVYQVGSFWYKYDASGNGAFATGNYSDGTSSFTFANGVKGAAVAVIFHPYSVYLGVNGTYSFYYFDDAPTQNVPGLNNGLPYTGTILYTSQTSNTLAANLTGSGDGLDLVGGLDDIFFTDANGAYSYILGIDMPDGWNPFTSIYYLNGESTNLDLNGDTFIDTNGSYTSHGGLVYNGGNPYTGSAYYGDDGYGNITMRIDFVNGAEVYNGPNV
jgi:hypothetical protein